jgi:excisionase family DNA binding protein
VGDQSVGVEPASTRLEPKSLNNQQFVSHFCVWELRETMNSNSDTGRPVFYTVAEAARILRVDPATLYRAIREDAFPAVRVRTRYVVPAVALEKLAAEAASTGGRVDVAQMAAQRRTARDLARLTGGAPW